MRTNSSIRTAALDVALVVTAYSQRAQPCSAALDGRPS